jgi:hypothetical protein
VKNEVVLKTKQKRIKIKGNPQLQHKTQPFKKMRTTSGKTKNAPKKIKKSCRRNPSARMSDNHKRTSTTGKEQRGPFRPAYIQETTGCASSFFFFFLLLLSSGETPSSISVIPDMWDNTTQKKKSVYR